MHALVREPGSQLVGQFTVPFKGTWSSAAIHQLQPDQLYDSLNVFIRQGKLRNRPGYLQIPDTHFDNPILGGAMAVTPTDKTILALSRSTVYTKSETGPWIPSTPFIIANSNNTNVDVTFMETSSVYTCLIASEGFRLKKWTEVNGLQEITPIVGAVPIAKSVCIAARRVVCLVPPHTVQWSAILTVDNYPALAYNRVAQTNDVGICVRTLSNLSFVLYKERSIYIARAQAGSDAIAFSFAEPIIVEGPAGVKAVVYVMGVHIYMTKNGRVALFDGSRYPQWICDGLWLHLQADIDPQYAHKITGVFDYRLHCVVFHYPKIGDDGLLKGMVLISIPVQGTGIDTYAAFFGYSHVPVSHACEVRFNQDIDRSLFFSGDIDNPTASYFDELTAMDYDTPYQCKVQTGLQALPDMRHTDVSVETYVERQDSRGHMQVSAVTSDILENDVGTIQTDTVQVIDLNSNPVQEYIGFNSPTRFFGLLYEWQSDNLVKWAGANIYGVPVV